MLFHNLKLQFREINKIHTGLKLYEKDGMVIIHGYLGFTVTILDEIYSDQYKIAIFITNKYPKKLPTVIETNKRIIRSDENHINGDGSLCVGRYPEIRKILMPTYSLNDYIEKIVINYLSQYSYKEKHGKWPYGESNHGATGIFDYYLEQYPNILKSKEDVINLLLKIKEANYRPKGYMRCNCGCNKLIKNCKFQKLLKSIRKFEKNVQEYMLDIDKIGG